MNIALAGDSSQSITLTVTAAASAARAVVDRGLNHGVVAGLAISRRLGVRTVVAGGSADVHGRILLQLGRQVRTGQHPFLTIVFIDACTVAQDKSLAAGHLEGRNQTLVR